MSDNRVFAPTIFFIAFRESLEAALVIGILSGTLEGVVGSGQDRDRERQKKLVKKMRIYVVVGALIGLFIAFCIGAAFLAVFYTQTADLYGRSEELWEGIFNLIAVVLITPMSLAILHADGAREKWRKKLSKAFAGMHEAKQEAVHGVEAAVLPGHHQNDAPEQAAPESADARTISHDSTSSGTAVASQEKTSADAVPAPADPKPKSKWRMILGIFLRPFEGDAKGPTAIFLIPLVTTLREGLEAVVFIGGVSLGLPASSIPLPAIVGLLCGFLVGVIVFKLGATPHIKATLLIASSILLVITAGMLSRAVYYFEFYKYVQKVGDAAAESGNGPASYDALNYVWHIDCCNPEDQTDNGGSGWSILNSLVGWNNTATVGSLTVYVLYWFALMAFLIFRVMYERRQNAKKTPEEAVHTEAEAATADV
ncbi:hypothetical protein MSPP1_003049 [Malassezia sp. CBS 17886]|nr:hypothetical protein MSPP1_003049 [Malassezia sp. CBS 17886]